MSYIISGLAESSIMQQFYTTELYLCSIPSKSCLLHILSIPPLGFGKQTNSKYLSLTRSQGFICRFFRAHCGNHRIETEEI